MSSTTPRIDREALAAMIDRACFTIESTPIPAELRSTGDGNGFDEAEVLALWIGAGLASQVGMALALDPSPYVIGFPPKKDDDAPESYAVRAECGTEALYVGTESDCCEWARQAEEQSGNEVSLVVDVATDDETAEEARRMATAREDVYGDATAEVDAMVDAAVDVRD
jgi:hypothetical protein